MPPKTRSQTSQQDAKPSPASTLNTEYDKSSGDRNRTFPPRRASSYAADEPTQHHNPNHVDEPDEPPRFTIDLSLPPDQRYLEVCTAFKDEMLNLTTLFDEVVGDIVRFLLSKWLHLLCRGLLRRVYDDEENAELKGISEATGVKMYLLVCFNVLLDLFMGCSSGGAAVGDHQNNPKMMHFRTLDWDMPSLRRVVVQLDFVREKDGPVFATSITYAGYVGVLTGVRQGLSMSLNFRPNRIENGVFWSDWKYRWHHLMVLLGRRQSISSLLRHFLLSPPARRNKIWLPFMKQRETGPWDYQSIVSAVAGNSRSITTTACYLCFSNGRETTTIEKDRVSAIAYSDEDFIVVTNNDIGDDTDDEQDAPEESESDGDQSAVASIIPETHLEEIVAEAEDRKECARSNWEDIRSKKCKKIAKPSEVDPRMLCTVDDVVEMVQRYPTANECTHFACVMDPTEGKVVWCRRWVQPVGKDWILAHMSPNYFLEE